MAVQSDISYLQFRNHTANTLIGFNVSGVPTLIGAFQGATGGADGAWGYVPTPLAGDQGKYLKGDGSWGTISAGGTLSSVGLSVSTSGTDITIEPGTSPVTGAGGIIQLNIPNAGPTSRGVITTVAQEIAGAKKLTSPLLVGTGTLTNNTTLDIQNISGLTTSIARFANTANTNVFRIELDGTIRFGSSSFASISPSTNTGTTAIASSGLRYYADNTGHWHTVEGSNIVSTAAFNFITTTSSLIATTSIGTFIRVAPSVASNPTPATGASLSILKITPTLSFSTGTTTIKGIEYVPNIIGSTGLTHYGLVVSGTSVLSGFGTTTPLATLHAVGTLKIDLGSDATGDTYYRNSSGFIVRRPATTDGFVYTLSGGIPVWAAPSGGGGTPGGANTEIQINASGSFGGGKIFVPANGDITLGDVGLAGTTRTIGVNSSSFSNLKFQLKTDASGNRNFQFAAEGNASFFNVTFEAIHSSVTNVPIYLLPKGSGEIRLASDTINLGNSTVKANLTLTNNTSTFRLGISNNVSSQALIQGVDGSAASNNGLTLSLKGGAGYVTSGNGVGGSILIQSGAKRSGGSGVDGNITIDSLTGFIFFTQSLINDNAQTDIIVRNSSTGRLEYRTAASLISGFSNTAGTNEVMKSTGSGGTAIPSGLFVATNGNIALGSGSISGNRTLSVVSSTANANLTISTQGTGTLALNIGATNVYSGTINTTTLTGVNNINLVTGASGSTVVKNSANARELQFSTVTTNNSITSVTGVLEITGPGVKVTSTAAVDLKHGSSDYTYLSTASSGTHYLRFKLDGTGFNTIDTFGAPLRIRNSTSEIYSIATTSNSITAGTNIIFTTGPTANYVAFRNSGTGREFSFNTTSGENRIDSTGAVMLLAGPGAKIVSTAEIDFTHGASNYTYFTHGSISTHFLRIKIAESSVNNTIDSLGTGNFYLNNLAGRLTLTGSTDIAMRGGTSLPIRMQNAANSRELTFDTVATDNTITSVGDNLFITTNTGFIRANAISNIELNHGTSSHIKLGNTTGNNREWQMNTVFTAYNYMYSKDLGTTFTGDGMMRMVSLVSPLTPIGGLEQFYRSEVQFETTSAFFNLGAGLGTGRLSVSNSTSTAGLMIAVTAPSSNPPSGMGVIYVESGALKYRSSNGTITTIAPF